MANNRGGIPMYNENPQYSATISSQLPQGSPAMFGTQVAKESAGLGDAMVKLGTNVVDWAVKMQEREDNAYLLRRDNEMRQKLNDLLYNPTNGLANQKGHNAQGVTGTFDEEVEKLTQQFMSDVGNPNMQARFQERVAQWLPGYRKNIAVHEGNEVFSANKLDIDTGIQDRIDEALRAPGVASAKVLYSSLGQNVADLMDVLGMSREAAAEYVQEKYSAGILQIAEALSGKGDTQGLLDLQKEIDGKVSAGTQSKLLAMTGKVQSQMKGIEKAKQLLNDPRFKNPDRTINLSVLQEFEKLYGKGSTRTEKVMVGGERQGAANAWAAYDVFKAAGYDDNAIAGILGRLQQEHNFSTEMAEEYDVPGIGRVGGFGMFQWQMDWNYGGRGNTMKQWAADNGLDPNDPKVQSQYALKEALDYGLTPEALNGKSAEEVADIWTRDWERGKPGEERRYAREWRERITAASKGGHYEERTVSNYNEQEYNEGYKYITEQIQFSKAEHDTMFENVKNDFLAKVKHVRTPTEVDNLAHSYGLTETDAAKLYNIGLGNRVDLATENQNYTDTKRAEERAEENFFAWWNDNPNASVKDIRNQAASDGVGSRLLHSILASEERKAKGQKTWYDDDQCKAAFNNALSQFGNKGNQKTHAMLRLNQKEAELAAEGKSLTPAMIEDEISDMNQKQIWYKGEKIRFGLPEADLEAANIDYLPGTSPNETKMNVQKDERGNYVEVDESTVEGWTP